jgi:hypothetical protein
MKKLYRFFILAFFLNGLNLMVQAVPAVLYSGKSINKSSFKLNRIRDSLKLHNGKSKDMRAIKPSLVFISPKTSFHTKYLYSTLNPNSIAFHKLDTATIPLNSSLSEIQVSSPIHSEMTLKYSLVQENMVTAKIFSVLGNEITTLFSERQNPGIQVKTFNISDKISSGIYILRITVGSQRIAKRIQVL